MKEAPAYKGLQLQYSVACQGEDWTEGGGGGGGGRKEGGEGREKGWSGGGRAGGCEGMVGVESGRGRWERWMD